LTVSTSVVTASYFTRGGPESPAACLVIAMSDLHTHTHKARSTRPTFPDRSTYSGTLPPSRMHTSIRPPHTHLDFRSHNEHFRFRTKPPSQRADDGRWLPWEALEGRIPSRAELSRNGNSSALVRQRTHMWFGLLQKKENRKQNQRSLSLRSDVRHQTTRPVLWSTL
jgi:hypothetical protein